MVKGGPGTGKSVIAQPGRHAQHATSSEAFTENFWQAVGPRSKAQVRYFNNFGQAEPGSIDVVLADEAYRIRTTSNHRFTRPENKSDRAQVDEILEATKVAVFFIDDPQAVRADEIGSTLLMHETAIRHNARFETFDLRTQFRGAGSDEYIDWVDQLLEIRKTGVMKLASSAFEVEIVADPMALVATIEQRNAAGQNARMMAGFCWPWSKPMADGQLINDATIGAFERPWNAQPDARKLAPGIPKVQFWATDPGGAAQIGCIYTAQGFEFGYAGVIWGEDHVIRSGVWVRQKSASRDNVVKTRSGERFIDVVKSAYRVLLTRGMQGCSICILDPETRAYVENRL